MFRVRLSTSFLGSCVVTDGGSVSGIEPLDFRAGHILFTVISSMCNVLVLAMVLRRFQLNTCRRKTASYLGSTGCEQASNLSGIARLLVLWARQVSLDESDEQDGTPLHYAAKKGFVGLAKVIVSAGGTVDVRNVKDMTPLHLVSSLLAISSTYILLNSRLDWIHMTYG